MPIGWLEILPPPIPVTRPTLRPPPPVVHPKFPALLARPAKAPEGC